MKIRNGFVSNSSSSSFIMLIPDSFNVDNIDSESDEIKKLLEYHGVEWEKVKKSIIDLISDEYLYDIEADEGIFSILKHVLSEYTIMSIDVGSDDGMISLLTESEKDKVRKLLSK